MASGSGPESTSQPGVADNIQPCSGASLVSRRRLLAAVSRSDVYRWAVRNFILTNSVPAVTWQKQINNFLRVFFLQSRRHTWWCRTLQIDCSFFHSYYVAKAEYLIITKREVTLDEVSVPWRALPKNKGLISSVVLGEASRRYRALKVRLSLQKKCCNSRKHFHWNATLDNSEWAICTSKLMFHCACSWLRLTKRERGLPFGRHSGFVDL